MKELEPYLNKVIHNIILIGIPLCLIVAFYYFVTNAKPPNRAPIKVEIVNYP